jgi:hypothetical protein
MNPMTIGISSMRERGRQPKSTTTVQKFDAIAKLMAADVSELASLVVRPRCSRNAIWRDAIEA